MHPMQIDLVEAKQALDRWSDKLAALCTVHNALPKLKSDDCEAPQDSNNLLGDILVQMKDTWKSSGGLAVIIQGKINARLDSLVKYRAAELAAYFAALERLVRARVDVATILAQYRTTGGSQETEFERVLREYREKNPEHFQSRYRRKTSLEQDDVDSNGHPAPAS